MGCFTLPNHWRYPATARCGDFCLLRFRPGPVHPSLDDLVNPGSPRSTISTSCLARTPDHHRKTRTELPTSTTASTSKAAGLQDRATGPSRSAVFSLLHNELSTLRFDTLHSLFETFRTSKRIPQTRHWIS